MDSVVEEGAGVITTISLQGFCLVTAGFRHEKGELLLLFRGHFLCDVMSNHLQNHKYDISPRMVSHVDKLDEIKGSNFEQDSALSMSRPNKLDWFT